MRPKIGIIIFILFFLSKTYGQQQINLTTFGEKVYIPAWSEIIGQDNENIYIFFPGLHMGFISSLPVFVTADKKTKKIKQCKEIKIPSTARGGKDQKVEGLFMLKNNLLLFTSYYDKKEDKNLAYAAKLDKNSGEFITELKEIDFINAAKKSNRGDFDFVLSKDSSKMLVYHSEPYEKYNNEKFSYKVLDANLNLIWGKGIELPFKDKEFAITEYTLDDEGNVYMLASFGKVNNTRKKSHVESPFKYIILAYSYKENGFKEYELNLEGKMITDIMFDINNTGNLICAGYYSYKKISSIAGAFFLSIDKQTQKVLKTGNEDFDPAFLSQLTGDKTPDQGDEAKNMQLDHLVLRADGGAILVGERYYLTKRGGGNSAYEVPHYNNIIVTNINPDGKIHWSKTIEKYQYTNQINLLPYDFFSYALGVGNEKLYLIFNDDRRNTELRKIPGKSLKSYNGEARADVMAAIIDANGQIEFVNVHSYEDKKIRIPNGSYLQISPDQLLMLGAGGGTETQIGTFDIK